MQFRLIAHRGGVVHRRSDENSRRAIEAAIVEGYDGIEIDVRETRDHVPVLHHEPRYGRLRWTGRAIGQADYRDLVDRARAVGRETLLTIEEAAELCSGQLRVMLEIKEPHPTETYLKRIRSALERFGLLDSLLVIGTAAGKRWFSGLASTAMGIREFRELGNRGPDVSGATVSGTGAARFLFAHGNELTTEDCLEAARMGLPVVPSVNLFHYTTISPRRGAARDIKSLISAGVDRFQIDSAFFDLFAETPYA